MNRDLAAVLAGMGHTDSLCIADAGLPIPRGVPVVDLALVCGVPPFLHVLSAVLAELVVEHATVALEMRTANPTVYRALREALGPVPVEEVPHGEFKTRTASARAVVRTGECTPYANVLLRSGVSF